MTLRSQVCFTQCDECGSRIIIEHDDDWKRHVLDAQQDLDGDCELYTNEEGGTRVRVGARGTGHYRRHMCPVKPRKNPLSTKSFEGLTDVDKALRYVDTMKQTTSRSGKPTASWSLCVLAAELRAYQAIVDELIAVDEAGNGVRDRERFIRVLREIRAGRYYT